VVKVMLTGATTVEAGALRPFGVALALGALGSAPEAMLPARGISTAQVVVPVACWLVVLAAHRRHRAPAAVNAVGSCPARPYSVLPYCAVAASVALLLVTAATAEPATRLIVAGAVVCLVGLVITRQVLAFDDNSRLVRQLDTGMAELAAGERRFRSLVRHSSDFITITGPGGVFIYVSPGAHRVLGLDPEEWTGRRPADLVHPDDLPAVLGHFDTIKDVDGASVVYEARLRHTDGTWRWTEVSLTNLLRDPAIGGMVGNARDITDERALRQRLRHQAHHDPLTGLANRTLFHHRLREALTATAVQVVLVDLNDFKTVNDTLGHHAGDTLITVIAQRLAGCVRSDDTVARLGGDEFAVLIPGATDDEVRLRLAGILGAFDESVDIAGYRTRVTASVGVAAGHDGMTANELLRRADVAMYAAKADRAGADTRHTHYTPALDTPIVDRVTLEVELRAALERDELRLLYQPIVTAGSGSVVAVEALLRWAHPQRGLLSPAQFVSQAERSGLILELGRWVLTTACHQAGRWHRDLPEVAPAVSVNVSARQLHDPTFVDHVAATLADTGLPAHRLTVEITETTALHPQSVEALNALHDLGVRISLDDFGTGHSSLSLLQSCPVDEVKLDRSFTHTAVTAGRRSVAAAVIELARALNLAAVAEGVETGEHADRLVQLGYDHLQGYHFARPTTPDDIERRIRANDQLRSGTCQSRTLLSAPPVASVRPSGLNADAVTEPRWPVSAAPTG
jgi:diguanylate cyclase (GGDEF)-like protein/PAS domain S-box-containing protein